MKSARHRQPLRLPPDHQERLRKQAERRGVSIQTYMHAAVLDRIEADEASYAKYKASRRERREERGGMLQGLGIRSPVAPAESMLSMAAAAPPVVVHVGTAGSSAPSEVERLAIFVADGPAFNRDQRLRQVVEMLKPSCASEREREQLARQLDSAVSERLKRRFGRLLGAAPAAADDSGRVKLR